MEELGIELDLSEVRPAFTINFHGGFDDCYLVEKDVDIKDVTIALREVKAVKEEILDLIEKDEFIAYHRAKIELMFFLRDHEGTHLK